MERENPADHGRYTGTWLLAIQTTRQEEVKTMVDMYEYSESVAGMRSLSPVGLLMRPARPREVEMQWVTSPAELVGPSVAIVPERCWCEDEDALSCGYPAGAPVSRAVSWKVIHVASGRMLVNLKFLLWARECAERLAALSVEWSRPELHHESSFRDVVRPVLREFADREYEFDRAACAGTAAQKRRAYRLIRKLGGQRHEHRKRPATPVPSQRSDQDADSQLTSASGGNREREVR